MNAYEFYLSTCKYVLLADPSNRSSWVDLYSYLPCLRQMLSCCVCGNILLKPRGPPHGICLHHVCRACVGGKMRLRPACSWCRTHEGFVDNPAMRLLILCFKKMCVYINSGPIGAEIRKAATNGTHTNTLIRVLDEAAAFEDDYVICNKVMPTCVPTYGMAPEPKLVSLPRGPHRAQAPSGTSVVSAGSRGRSNSALSTQSHHSNKDTPPTLASFQSAVRNLDKDKDSANHQLKVIDQLDKMPALLAPCTQGITTPEKLSPPLSGTQRADVHDQQGSDLWDHVTRYSHHHHGDNRQRPVNNASPDVTVTSAIHTLGKQTLKSKVKKGFMAQQGKVKIKGKYPSQRKVFNNHDIDFEPPCKRTRLASSLTGSEFVALSSRKECQCARFSPNSGLFCFGQRCLCYSSCLCRGCHDPRKAPLTMSNVDYDKSDGEHDPPMPVLSPEPRL